MTTEKAIQKCVDNINQGDDGESADIYRQMYKYKVIRDMTPAEQDEVYDEIAFRLGFIR